MKSASTSSSNISELTGAFSRHYINSSSSTQLPDKFKLHILRFALLATALMKLVLPVPGGPLVGHKINFLMYFFFNYWMANTKASNLSYKALLFLSTRPSIIKRLKSQKISFFQLKNNQQNTLNIIKNGIGNRIVKDNGI